jgi:sulfide:quinone oxidoreductase
MLPKKLNEEISVTTQLSPEDIAQAKAQGFKSIICNRPDNEEETQPNFCLLQDHADNHGLEIKHLPVPCPNVTVNDIHEFRQCLEELPKPVLAFCKTGTRSTTLWANSQKGKIDNQSIQNSCKSAGYDIKL